MEYPFKILESNCKNHECIEFNNKKYYIPIEELKTNAEYLDIDYDEAIMLWLEDNDYIKNEEVEKLTQKAKENKTVEHKAKQDKPRKKAERTPKEYPTKERIIAGLALFTQQNISPTATITNKSKTIDFELEGERYTITLTQHRKKKRE